MNETDRYEIRTRRAEILAHIRRKAYAVHGIELVEGGAEDDRSSEKATSEDAIADPSSTEEVKPPSAPVTRLLREGRSMPLDLVDPAPIPGKWQRLDLQLPTLEFRSDDEPSRLSDSVEASNLRLRNAVSGQIEAWVAGEGAPQVWRDALMDPANTLTEDAWIAATGALASRPIDRSQVIPDLSKILVKVDRQQEFLDAERMSFRVALDNQSMEARPQDASVRCNTIFGASLVVEFPRAAHRPLRLDRVEPLLSISRLP